MLKQYAEHPNKGSYTAHVLQALNEVACKALSTQLINPH